jgi:hypothetical protein
MNTTGSENRPQGAATLHELLGDLQDWTDRVAAANDLLDRIEGPL